MAISVDLPSAEARTQAQQGVPFAILSDPTLVAHRAFNVDRAGVIRFAHVDEDYETRPSARQLLEVAERALRPSSE